MLVRVNGVLVHELFEVVSRPERRLDHHGARVRCRRGWVIAGECNGLFAGELAMVVTEHIAGPQTPPWIASGDLERVEETAGCAEQLPLGGA